MPVQVPWAITADVAFATDPADEPNPGDWTTLTTRLRATRPLRVSHGAGRLVGGGDGACQVTLNNQDRAIDPTNPLIGLNLVPIRHTRLQVTVDGSATFPLFRGFAEDWQPEWSPIDSEIDARLVDWFAWSGLQDADLDLPRQMSHERIIALLDLAGVPAALRDIADGVIEVEPYEQASANLLRTMIDTAEAERGDFYVAPDGKITFRSRHARLNPLPVLTLGGGTGITISGARPVPWDKSRLTNIGRVELDDGRVFETIDNTSIGSFGRRVMPIRDLPLRAAEAEAVAQWEVVRFAHPRLWIDNLQVQGRLPGVLAQIMALRVGDAVRVIHQPPAGGTIDEILMVERITHSITNVSWLTGLDLSPNFGDGPWLILDDPVFGRLDVNMLTP